MKIPTRKLWGVSPSLMLAALRYFWSRADTADPPNGRCDKRLKFRRSKEVLTKKRATKRPTCGITIVQPKTRQTGTFGIRNIVKGRNWLARLVLLNVKLRRNPSLSLRRKSWSAFKTAQTGYSITSVKVNNKECYISDQEVSIERRKHRAFGNKPAKIGN